MKSISWVEFFVTFSIFISLLLYTINYFQSSVISFISNIREFKRVQDLSINAIKILINDSTISNEYPYLIFHRNYKKINCKNCINIYTDPSYFYIEQNAKNRKSKISLLITSENPIIFEGNASITCIDYYNLSMVHLYYQKFFKYCTITLENNSFIKFPGKWILIDNIKTYLEFYIGRNKVNLKYMPMYSKYLIVFKVKNKSIFVYKVL